uniref:Nucleoprotein n=2 Tax=Influenza D virus TaxID=1511084 RepID=A0A7D5A931_9ORTO|nr:nucleoprotein [Influenza D virus (D/bovine/Mississippi/C00046N/2014)]QKU36012.1 nucleoprotein [Influenza D virus]QKU36076.1 nucleoprotein [Influenza D virus]QKU36115.1 nucleoprotein [Influenza D virus]
MDSTKAQTPEEQRAKNAKTILENIQIYERMCDLFGVSEDDKLIIENSISIERMIRVVTDKKYQDKKLKNAGSDPEKIANAGKVFCRLVESTAGKCSARLGMALKPNVEAVLTDVLGNELDRAAVLGKRMGFSAMFKSNLEEVLYQRGKNQLKKRNAAETFTLSQGASLEARFRPIMEKHLGVGTVVASIKNILASKKNGNYRNKMVRKPGGNRESWSPLEREISFLNKKLFPGPMRQLCKKFEYLNDQEKQLALNLMLDASLILKPQVTHKMIMPWSMWLAVKKYAEMNKGSPSLEDLAAYSGVRAFMAFNTACYMSKFTIGKGIVGDAEIMENGNDKMQTLAMACFGLAYEDTGIVAAMISQPMKKRYQLRVGNFNPPEEGTIKGTSAGYFHKWAEFGNRLPFNSFGTGESKQISNSGVFAVQRPSTTNIQRLAELMARNTGETSDNFTQLVQKIREQVGAFADQKANLREFTGGYIYDIADVTKSNPKIPQLGGDSFFFEFTGSDVPRTGAKRRVGGADDVTPGTSQPKKRGRQGAGAESSMDIETVGED